MEEKGVGWLKKHVHWLRECGASSLRQSTWLCNVGELLFRKLDTTHQMTWHECWVIKTAEMLLHFETHYHRCHGAHDQASSLGVEILGFGFQAFHPSSSRDFTGCTYLVEPDCLDLNSSVSKPVCAWSCCNLSGSWSLHWKRRQQKICFHHSVMIVKMN